MPTAETFRGNGWTRVTDGMPDADIMVLIAIPDGDDHSEPVWLGYTDGELWNTAEGMPVRVSHWREMPESPGVAS